MMLTRTRPVPKMLPDFVSANVYCILLVFFGVHYSYLNLCVILITASIICYFLTEKLKKDKNQTILNNFS